MSWQGSGSVPKTVHNPFLQLVQNTLYIAGCIGIVITIALFNADDSSASGLGVLFGIGTLMLFGAGSKIRPTRQNTRHYR